jgi:hypothetical protein
MAEMNDLPIAGAEVRCYGRRDLKPSSSHTDTHRLLKRLACHGEGQARGCARPHRPLDGGGHGSRMLRILLAAALLIASVPALALPAAARDIKLWRFFEYQSDPAAGTRSVKLFGPFIEYRRDPDYLRVALRPLFSIRQARTGHDDEVHLLYPFLISRWGKEEQTTTVAGGLLRYRTTTNTEGATVTSEHFEALPFYFYDWEQDHGAKASLVPLYADLENTFGYERVQMILFPAYLRLQRPSVDRRWLPFPFYSTVTSPAASEAP